MSPFNPRSSNKFSLRNCSFIAVSHFCLLQHGERERKREREIERERERERESERELKSAFLIEKTTDN